MMPGRKYQVGSGTYHYSINGQEKTPEIVLNTTNAEFWQYDARIVRRWNLDPKPTVGISDYSTFGNNPIVNVDPNGDLFFGLFGSTSAQRQSAKKLRDETGGKINDMYKKNINAQYRTWGEESEFTYQNDKSSDPTRMRGVVSQAYRTYFDKKTGKEDGIDYYDATSRNWKHYETVQTYRPDFYDNWSQSDNLIGKASYSFVNSFYVTGQNLFTKRFTRDCYAVNLNGEVTNAKENVDAFISAGTTFIPAEKTIKGFTYLEKFNTAQFSKFFKGTVIVRAQPIVRGQINRGLNYIFMTYNGFVPSGKVMFPIVKSLYSKGED